MAKIVSIFNHKGGVSKTTTTFHLGWMLAKLGRRVILVDADPQCNLTGVSLGLDSSWPPGDIVVDDDLRPDEEFAEAQADTSNFFTRNIDQTLYGALRPAFESEPRLMEPVDCVPIESRAGLFLLPGHLQLGEYEVALGIAQELSGTILPLRNIPGAVNYLLRQTAESLQADYVLVDMSPSLGSLNQNIVATSDLVFVPTTPDFYTLMAIRSLARILPGWYRWAQQASGNDALRTATYGFPVPRLKFAGAIIQRYRLYRAPTADNPYGDPTGPFQQWINRVSEAFRDDLLPALNAAGLLLDPQLYTTAGVNTDDLVLGRIQEFNSLLPKSQEHRVPVYELTQDQLQQTGVVWDASKRQIESLHRIFRDIATKLDRVASAQG